MANKGLRDQPIAPRGGVALAICAVLSASACNAEKREIGPAPPSSPPTGLSDLRKSLYDTNRYEQAEGGRLFRWSGCDQCHTETASGFVNLTDKNWRRGGSTPAIYQTITVGGLGMPGYGTRLTVQEIWQVAGYVGSLNKMKPAMRRRSNAAQQGEPSGASWQDALR